MTPLPSPGLSLVQRFELALLPCAAILLYSAYGILFLDDDDEDLSQNAVVQLTKRWEPASQSAILFLDDDGPTLTPTRYPNPNQVPPVYRRLLR